MCKDRYVLVDPDVLAPFVPLATNKKTQGEAFELPGADDMWSRRSSVGAEGAE